MLLKTHCNRIFPLSPDRLKWQSCFFLQPPIELLPNNPFRGTGKLAGFSDSDAVGRRSLKCLRSIGPLNPRRSLPDSEVLDPVDGALDPVYKRLTCLRLVPGVIYMSACPSPWKSSPAFDNMFTFLH